MYPMKYALGVSEFSAMPTCGSISFWSRSRARLTRSESFALAADERMPMKSSVPFLVSNALASASDGLSISSISVSARSKQMCSRISRSELIPSALKSAIVGTASLTYGSDDRSFWLSASFDEKLTSLTSKLLARTPDCTSKHERICAMCEYLPSFMLKTKTLLSVISSCAMSTFSCPLTMKYPPLS
eukprot:Amastigsp_a348729_7.p3 type:complete len:187 gc:universal Amastigsp_a348729_7:1261-701(-)